MGGEPGVDGEVAADGAGEPHQVVHGGRIVRLGGGVKMGGAGHRATFRTAAKMITMTLRCTSAVLVGRRRMWEIGLKVYRGRFSGRMVLPASCTV